MAKSSFVVEVTFKNCSIDFMVCLKRKWVYSFQYLFYHLFFLEVTLMVPSFPQESKHLKAQDLVHLKSVYKILL